MGVNTGNVENIWAPQVRSDIGFRGNGVLLAVLDTGIDYDHTDLKSNTWQNLGENYDDGHTLEHVNGSWQLDSGDLNNADDDRNGYRDNPVGSDFYTPDSDPMDANNHGSHVAGIASAASKNNKSISELSWNSILMAIKITDATEPFTGGRIYDGIFYAVDNGAHIVNCSFFCYFYSFAQYSAVSQAHQNNCIVSAGAGNTKGWPRIVQYPAALSSQQNIIA